MSRLPIVSALLLLTLQHETALAQFFSYEREEARATQSISAVYTAVDFSYAGGKDPEVRYDYSDAAYGVSYTRPNLTVAVLYGRHLPTGRPDPEKLQLVDASLFTWAELNLTRDLSGRTRFFIPILVHSSHRRVSGEQVPALASTDAFSVTVIGVGTGAGFNGTLRKVQVELRATPVIGFATRSFGDATGSTRLFDGDLMVHFGPIAGPVGLSIGYGFRAQAWDVGSSNLLQNEDKDLFDYRGHLHAFRLGINW